jgi:hypothetical protein
MHHFHFLIARPALDRMIVLLADPRLFDPSFRLSVNQLISILFMAFIWELKAGNQQSYIDALGPDDDDFY